MTKTVHAYYWLRMCGEFLKAMAENIQCPRVTELTQTCSHIIRLCHADFKACFFSFLYILKLLLLLLYLNQRGDN